MFSAISFTCAGSISFLSIFEGSFFVCLFDAPVFIIFKQKGIEIIIQVHFGINRFYIFNW